MMHHISKARIKEIIHETVPVATITRPACNELQTTIDKQCNEYSEELIKKSVEIAQEHGRRRVREHDVEIAEQEVTG